MDGRERIEEREGYWLRWRGRKRESLRKRGTEVERRAEKERNKEGRKEERIAEK